MKEFFEKMMKNESYKSIHKVVFNIYFLLASVFVFRLLLLFLIGNPFEYEKWFNWIWAGDSPSYLRFANVIYNQSFDFLPQRLPGYPLIILLTREVLGIEWLGTIILQQIISILSAWFIYKIVTRYINTNTLIAPLVFLFEPIGLIISFKILPEAFMVLAILATTYLIVKASSEYFIKKLLLVITSSIILCIGVFFKPILLYSFIIYIVFILIYFQDNFKNKLLYVLVFLVIFHLPIHIYKEIIYEKFGVYCLARQEFSEKMGRAIDIKYLAENKKVMNIDSLRAEVKYILMLRGYDFKNPDYVLHAQVSDSLVKLYVRKYLPQFIYYSFSESYFFFQPATSIITAFIKNEQQTTRKHFSTFTEQFSFFKKLLLSTENLIIIIFSLLFSMILILPVLITVFNRNLRVQYSPLIYFALFWFFYTSVMVGRIAQARYRITFSWILIILLGIVISYIKNNGWRSIIPTFKSKS